MKKIIAISFSVVLLGLLSACTTDSQITGRDYVAPGVSATMSVAVAPFENLSTHPKAGLVAAQLITTELYVQQLFQPMEETEMRRKLKQSKVNIARLADASYAREVAGILGVDGILIGSVSEYGYQHGLHEEPTVGFNARLVRSDSGEVVWAASHSETGRGYLRRDSVNEAAQRVARRMVENLSTQVAHSSP